jgi:sulfoxide reductase heme-binding subunit YedZ
MSAATDQQAPTTDRRHHSPAGRLEGLRTQGRSLVGLVATLAVAAVALTLLRPDVDVDAFLTTNRWLARTGWFFFIAAFTASAWYRLAPGLWSRRLLVRRRWVGLTFAATFAVHLAAIALYRATFPATFDDNVSALTLTVGGLGFAGIGVMALTSNDLAVEVLGARRWRTLHLGVSWYVWFVFVATLAGDFGADPFSTVALLVTLAAAALRAAATRSGSKRDPTL